MNEEYLWNRTGEPDEEIVRLEKLLAPLKHKPAKQPRRRLPVWPIAAAAAVLAGLIAAPLISRGRATAWTSSNGRHIRAGQTIESGKIEASDTGEVTVEAGSRFRLLAANDREERFDLRRGTIHAFIWAPPGRFVVDTPSSRTVDLGCRYTLQVSQNGTGLLTVELGWVAFEKNKIESFIPAGAACVTRPGKGPGTPYFADAPIRLKEALARFDSSGDGGALNEAISESRDRDALSLWHLMVHTKGGERGRVFDRLASLVRLPSGATREAVLRGDGQALDAAWDALDLGNTDWWRQWKQPW